MPSKSFTAPLAVALLMLLGCGQSSPAAAAALDVAVVVRPPSASVLEAGTTAFSAAVTGAVDVSVTWYVLEGSAGGSVSGGVYVAPATAGTYHVVARSVANGAEAQATVVVLPPSATTGTVEKVYVNDAATTTGHSVTMVADVTVSGTVDKSLSWSVDSGSLGSIDAATGVYTAPATAGRYKVWATSKADPTKKDYGFVDVTAVGGTPGGGGSARIVLLRHSTGQIIYDAGVPAAIQAWNSTHGTNYTIERVTYPSTAGGYPWANYAYDYWNLWVNHAGARYLDEMTLEELVQSYDVIILKHCHDMSYVEAPDGSPSVSSPIKTFANYQLQYNALKARLLQFPTKKFIVWTGSTHVQGITDLGYATRYAEFENWVRNSWDQPGDNIFVWDYNTLQTDGGLYETLAHAVSNANSHPNTTFAAEVAPLLSQRIIDVVEGRGDTGSLTGR